MHIELLKGSAQSQVLLLSLFACENTYSYIAFVMLSVLCVYTEINIFIPAFKMCILPGFSAEIRE